MCSKQIILSTIITLALDSVYLSATGKYYNKVVKDVQGTGINARISGAIICYLFLVLSVNYFILNDRKKTLLDAFILGIVIYGVYETTNYAIFKKWSTTAVIMDTLWGGILFTLTVYLTRLILKSPHL